MFVLHGFLNRSAQGLIIGENRFFWYNIGMGKFLSILNLIAFLGMGVVAMISMPAHAQEIVQDPICFVVRNEANFMVYGNFGTDYYTRPDGIKARHRSNFRFDPAGSFDSEGYESDRAEFCSYGPFYPGRKLELVLRTLFPVFSCKTRIDQGEIVIKGKRKADDSGVDMWAECYE